MSSGKNSFVFYETTLESLEALPDCSKLKLYRAVAYYGNYGNIPDDLCLNEMEKAFLIQIKFGIDQAKKIRIVNQENGAKAGNRLGNKNAFKDKKCSACINYRHCEHNVSPYECPEYNTDYKNKNEQNPALTSKNDLNVNVNVNDNVNVIREQNVPSSHFLSVSASDECSTHENNIETEEINNDEELKEYFGVNEEGKVNFDISKIDIYKNESKIPF